MPESEDIKELKKELGKLKPEAKLKKLKELEEKTKANITDIEELIKDSEKELKTEEVAEEIAPEQTVKKDAPETPEKEERGYISFQQAYSDYTRLQDITYASMMGPLSAAQEGTLDKIGERLDQSKYQSASDEIANILVASRSVLYKIKKYAGVESERGY